MPARTRVLYADMPSEALATAVTSGSTNLLTCHEKAATWRFILKLMLFSPSVDGFLLTGGAYSQSIPSVRHARRPALLLGMTPRSPSSQLIGLLGWVLLAFAAGAVGAVASVDAASFYAQLSKPTWAPPAWLFGPVWSALYALMGVAAWLVWRSPGSTRVALGLFGAQLAVNALWSWLFFAWHRGALATVGVLVLLALITATAAAFWRASRRAALLLMPYLLWVSFASVLTWVLWRNNLGLL